jgi:hypothetical protein
VRGIAEVILEIQELPEDEVESLLAGEPAP